MNDIYASSGTDCNRVKIGSKTILRGDPKIRPEKPYTIICFPGGDVEIARCDNGTYWVHIAVRSDVGSHESGRIIDARMDHTGRYNDEGNAALRDAVQSNDVSHIAFLIAPPGVLI